MLLPKSWCALVVVMLIGLTLGSESADGQSGRGGLMGQIRRESVQAELKLTDEQKAKLEVVFKTQRDKRRKLFQEMRSGNADRDRISGMMGQVRKDAENEALAILTPEQKQVWEQKIGLTPTGEAAVTQGSGATRSRGGRRRRRGFDAASRRASSTENFSESSDGPRNVVASFAPQPVAGQAGEAGKSGGVADAQSQDADPFPKGKPTRLSFSFRYAPWEDVLKFFAEAAGLTLDLTEVPPGTFNYLDKRQYTPLEALDILNGYLLQRGYVLVHRDQFLVVVNIDKGIPPNLVPTISIDDLPKRGKNELLSVIFPLEDLDAEQAAKEVGALLGPQGKVAPLTSSKAVVVTDIGSNLLRIQRLLKGAKPGPKEMTFRMFPLKNVSAIYAERIIRNQLGLPTAVQNVSSNTSNRRSGRGRDFRRFFAGRFGSRRRGRDSGSQPSAASSSQTSSQDPGKAQVTADARTNSVLVTATATQLKIVEAVVRAIDVREDSTGGPLAAGNQTPRLKVYEVKSADPGEVAKTINAMMPGVVINQDTQFRRIHTFATPAEHQQIERLIRQLEGGESGLAVAVISLSRIDAVTAASTLQSLFTRDGDQAPTIQAELMGQRLMVRGTPAQITQVRSVLTQLGENGSTISAGVPSLRGPVRTISLGGRNPREVLRLLERYWSASNRNPIRIIDLSKESLIQEKRTPSKDDSEIPEASRYEVESKVDVATAVDENAVDEDLEDEEIEDNDDSLDEFLELFDVEEQPDEQLQDTGQPGGTQPGKNKAERQSSPTDSAPVAVSVSGGNLIVGSADENALDRLQRLIETLVRGIPVRTGWTVYYLRSSDASDTAAMLEQILSAGLFSMSTTSTGLVGSSQRLRIIPETRSNALFVSGPALKVQDVEELLKILDSSELPESLRDRIPRLIPVEHADAAQVAEIIKEVYQADMSGETRNTGGGSGTRGGGGTGRRDTLVGNGNNRGRQNRPRLSAARLTVGVDTRTNQLVVSASDALHRQIQALVQSLDRAALEAKPTVRVVKLATANSLVVQQALGSLFPKIKVSTTGRSSSSAASTNLPSSRTSRQPPSGNSRRSEDIRSLFEQRFRDQNQQQPRGPRSRGTNGDTGRSTGRENRSGFRQNNQRLFQRRPRR